MSRDVTDEEALDSLRDELGTARVGEILGVSKHSVRRWSSVGVPKSRVDDVLELYQSVHEFDEFDEPDRGAELDEEELDELAEAWGVKPSEVEDLADLLGPHVDLGLGRDELREYVDDLWAALTEEGWDLDVSDLWDMYYGYTPGGKE